MWVWPAAIGFEPWEVIDGGWWMVDGDRDKKIHKDKDKGKGKLR